MFARIAPRYDLLNHLLSLNIDRSWRRRAVRRMRLHPGAKVLDICTGTGDLALEVRKVVSPAEGGLVVGTDFTPEMLRIARRKGRRLEALHFVMADALELPFRSSCFDAVTVSFGIRNVRFLERCLDEMLRVLVPGGVAAILEFSALKGGWIGRAFHFYFHHILPRIGGWVSGSAQGREAYAYLPRSVEGFPSPAALLIALRNRGFTEVRSKAFTFGIAVLHLANRPGGAQPAAIEEVGGGGTP